MLEIKEKQECCGCTACVAACPKECIVMKEDQEGFLYPNIDKDKCIRCGICEKVCPILNETPEIPTEQTAYIVQNKNERVLQESTAGGAFTSIAKYALKNKGVVFGVELDSKLVAHHIYIESEKELFRFRNSKYVQSSVGDAFWQVRSFLDQGRIVCFSGTPCQVEGLKSYLGKDYEKLITVDVVCHAVPSPLIFRKYVEYQERRLSDTIKTVRFRDKYYGYKYSTMNVITDNNQGNYHHGIESDPWLRAFFSNICDRPSCYHCHFKKRYRQSDFTIWDCFHVGRFSRELDNDKGATRVLVHSERGKKIFDAVKSEFHYIQMSPAAIVAGTKEMYRSIEPNERRQNFFDDAQSMSGTELFCKYFPETFRTKAEHFARLLCHKLGVYGAIKKIVVSITHKY